MSKKKQEQQQQEGGGTAWETLAQAHSLEPWEVAGIRQQEHYAIGQEVSEEAFFAAVRRLRGYTIG